MYEAVTLPPLPICPYEFYKSYLAVIKELYYTGADISGRAVKGGHLRLAGIAGSNSVGGKEGCLL